MIFSRFFDPIFSFWFLPAFALRIRNWWLFWREIVVKIIITHKSVGEVPSGMIWRTESPESRLRNGNVSISTDQNEDWDSVPPQGHSSRPWRVPRAPSGPDSTPGVPRVCLWYRTNPRSVLPNLAISGIQLSKFPYIKLSPWGNFSISSNFFLRSTFWDLSPQIGQEWRGESIEIIRFPNFQLWFWACQ